MARRDALIRLHHNLKARRADLYKRLGLELRDLGNMKSSAADSADAAFDSGSEDVATRLAELEAKELRQIERALLRMKQGTYGQCEVCHTRIPVARLNALPYSTLCVRCQQEMEQPNGFGAGNIDWEKVSDGDSGFDESRRLDVSDLELDLSK